jgi:hypothetical protein
MEGRGKKGKEKEIQTEPIKNLTEKILFPFVFFLGNTLLVFTYFTYKTKRGIMMMIRMRPFIDIECSTGLQVLLSLSVFV